MLVTLLTPTGARPDAFALCERWMKNQTYKGKLQWLCVDDYSQAPTQFTMGQEQVTAPVPWTPSINTQRGNMDALMKWIKGDVIFVIEDDEYYHPHYIISN